MANVILSVFIVTGIIFCIFSAHTKSKFRINYIALCIGLISLFIAFFAHTYTYSMKLDIQKRDMTQLSQDEIVYELITIESNDEDTEFHFYYRTEVDGVEGMKPKTISSDNVFVVETNQCKPMVIENTTIYDYELTDFERWWLGSEYLEKLQQRIHQYYEIYVPEGTFEREYNLK